MTPAEKIKFWHNFIDGDINSLSELFMYHSKGLISYGMKICPDEQLVQDSIQEVFVQLILNRHKLKRNLNISGLIYKMLRNKIIDEIKLINRSRKNDNQMFVTSPGFELDFEHQYIDSEEEIERNTLLNRALDQLSAHQKEAMFLKYSNFLSYEEISVIMGISIASARTLIYRTLKQMRSLLSIK